MTSNQPLLTGFGFGFGFGFQVGADLACLERDPFDEKYEVRRRWISAVLLGWTGLSWLTSFGLASGGSLELAGPPGCFQGLCQLVRQLGRKYKPPKIPYDSSAWETSPPFFK